MSFSPEETPHQISLEGLTIRVEDVERSLAFYTKLPGAQVVIHRKGIFALVRIGTGRLGLLQQPSAPLFHLELETLDDLETLAQQLQASGIDQVKKPARKKWGEVDFTVRDPDGNVLEFDTTGQPKIWEEERSTSTDENA